MLDGPSAPGPDQRGKAALRRIAIVALYSAATVFGILSAIVLSSVFPGGNSGSQTPYQPPTADIVDPPSESIAKASLDPFLTQWGTDTPYSGSGAPGLQLKVQAPDDVLGWALSGWANETASPPIRFCHQNGVHYGTYDWVFESRQGSSGTSGVFTSVPTTVQQRLGPDGDQCFARFGATGVWHIKVCVNDGGPPQGLYRDDGGNTHFDGWDKCVERDFQVG